MKNVIAVIMGYVVFVAFVVAAIVSPTGMGIDIPGAPLWLPKVASIIENFVPVIAIVMFLAISFILAVGLMNDELFGSMADEAIKRHGDAEKAFIKSKFNRFRLLITVPYWIVLIGAGWVFSAVLVILSWVAARVLQSFTSDAIKERMD
jgi:hypothetical protein